MYVLGVASRPFLLLRRKKTVKEVTNMDRILLNAKDVQERLGIGRDRAYRLLNSKSFPTIKINKSLFVTNEALDEWINMQQFKTFNL